MVAGEENGGGGGWRAVTKEVYRCGVFFSSRRRHTRYWRDWSSDVCSSDLVIEGEELELRAATIYRRIRIIDSLAVVGGKLCDDDTFARTKRIVSSMAGEAPYSLAVAYVVIGSTLPNGQLASGVRGVELCEIKPVEVLYLVGIVIYFIELITEIIGSRGRFATRIVNLFEDQRAHLEAFKGNIDRGSAVEERLVDGVSVDVILRSVGVIGHTRHGNRVDTGHHIVENALNIVELFGVMIAVGIVVELESQLLNLIQSVDIYFEIDVNLQRFYLLGVGCVAETRAGSGAQKYGAEYLINILFHCSYDGFKVSNLAPYRSRSRCSSYRTGPDSDYFS